ncbi:MAG: hypothetical protein KF782_31660 [Labilithrix sp.]|nr:hypothetical protein [Labilithrix sp.]
MANEQSKMSPARSNGLGRRVGAAAEGAAVPGANDSFGLGDRVREVRDLEDVRRVDLLRPEDAGARRLVEQRRAECVSDPFVASEVQ